MLACALHSLQVLSSEPAFPQTWVVSACFSCCLQLVSSCHPRLAVQQPPKQPAAMQPHYQGPCQGSRLGSWTDSCRQAESCQPGMYVAAVQVCSLYGHAHVNS
mgnify:CR=1 FL=1